METRVVNPWTWQDRFGFVQSKEVTQATRTLYCAGQTSVDDQGTPLHEGDMEAQALQALANLETVLRASGFELADVARLNTYVVDVDAYRRAAAPAVGVRWLRRAVGRGRRCSASRAWRCPSCSSSSRPRRSSKAPGLSHVARRLRGRAGSLRGE
jgi:enamine deaminase RidA (YjgF/YER057c/UK114 family)